jgi:hypothetical protein
MEVKLPSGNTVTFRDRMMRDDIVQVRKAMKFVTAPDGSRTTDGDFIDTIRSAIFRRMIVSWSFGPAVPGTGSTPELADRILGQYLDEDDSLAMDIAVQPWVDKIMSDPATSRNSVVHAGTGIKVRASSQEDAEALVATGEFEHDGDSGPKRQSPTAITFSGEPSGPTTAE